MYYNVIIKDAFWDDENQNKLVFCFGDNYEKAIKFVNYIAKISDYHIEFLQCKENDVEDDMEE